MPDTIRFSGGGSWQARTLGNMPPRKPQAEEVEVRFPVIEVPESEHVKGEFGTWQHIVKPNCRPYYMATLHLATRDGDDHNVNFIIDPDDDTPDDVLQARVEERVIMLVRMLERV